MAITFVKAEFPTNTRNKKDNEYAPLVADMIESKESRQAVLTCKNAEERKAVDNLIYMVQAAGRDAGVSVRKDLQIKDGKATVTFIVRDKITRTRKPVEAAADAPAEEVSAPAKATPAKPGPRK